MRKRKMERDEGGGAKGGQNLCFPSKPCLLYNVALLILNKFRCTIYIYTIFSLHHLFFFLPVQTHLRYVFYVCPADSEKKSHDIFLFCAEHMEHFWSKKVHKATHFIGTASVVNRSDQTNLT